MPIGAAFRPGCRSQTSGRRQTPRFRTPGADGGAALPGRPAYSPGPGIPPGFHRDFPGQPHPVRSLGPKKGADGHGSTWGIESSCHPAAKAGGAGQSGQGWKSSPQVSRPRARRVRPDSIRGGRGPCRGLRCGPAPGSPRMMRFSEALYRLKITQSVCVSAVSVVRAIRSTRKRTKAQAAA